MEDKSLETWECPNCHSTGNTARFCAKCGTERPIVDEPKDQKEDKKKKSTKIIEMIIAIAMIVFFSLSLVLVLSPMIELYNTNTGTIDQVNFYYFFYTVWANLKSSSGAINIVKAIVSTIAFIAAVGVVYFFGVTGLVDSIKVIKTHKDPQYSKPMIGVIGAMLGYYAIVSQLYVGSSYGNGYSSSNSSGSGIAFFAMLMIGALIALMARSLVLAIIDKKPFKIAASIIKFLSILFVIFAVLSSTQLGMTYTASGIQERFTFFNWTVAFFAAGSVEPGVTTLIGTITTVLSVATGIGALCLSYASLIDDKHDKKASIFTIAFCGLLFLTIVMSTATFFLVSLSESEKFVPYNTPAAVILSLLGIIGITVASALEKEKKVN